VRYYGLIGTRKRKMERKKYNKHVKVIRQDMEKGGGEKAKGPLQRKVKKKGDRSSGAGSIHKNA